MSDLVIHRGGFDATLADLACVPVPEATGRWQPVPYPRFIEEVKIHVPRFGFRVAQEQYALAREGGQMFGVLTFEATTVEDYALCVGLRNSYDKSLAAALVAGSRVFVCDNLAFNGEVEMARRHTIHVFRDLPDLIYQMLNGVAALRTRQDAEITHWKAADLDRRLVNHLLMEAVRHDALPASTIPRVLAEYEAPQFEEFGPRTAWSLYNAFTATMRNKSPRAIMDESLRLSTVFREVLPVPA